jgi:hypothetical protein
MKDNKRKEKLMRSYIYASLLLTAVLATAFTGRTSLEKSFLGRWDIDVLSSSGFDYINRVRFCWLELKLENGTLKGRIQPGEGATVDVTEIKIENGELSFKQGRAIWKGTARGKRLEGTVNSPIFGKKTRSWTGVRGPVWSAKPPIRKPGKPVNLIGKDVSDWLVQKPGIPRKMNPAPHDTG